MRVAAIAGSIAAGLAVACNDPTPTPSAPSPRAQSDAGSAPTHAIAEPTEVDPKTRSTLFRPLEAKLTEPARTHVVAMGFDGTAATATIGAWKLEESGLIEAGRTRIDAVPNPRWPGHHLSLVSHDGGDHWMALEPKNGELAIVRRHVDGREVGFVPIGADPPAALHAFGTRVFVGRAAAVALADFAAPHPALTVLHERADMYGKPYDLFVRSGDWLVAIDDEVSPIYADTFTIGEAAIVHDTAWDMPTFINGSYYAGALRVDAARTGTLYALAHYGIMSGNGQDLVALPLERGKLTVGGDVILNGRVLTSPPVLEEHADRGSGKPDKLVAGTEMTGWRDLAVAPAAGDSGRLLIAASERGLLSLPTDFGPSTKADMIDLGGPCLDVRVEGGVVHALVGEHDSTLVMLDAASFEVRARHALGGHFDHLP